MSKIIAPNRQYNGISATVQFYNGVGETSNPHLIEWFKATGYTVEEETPKEVTPEIIHEEVIQDELIKDEIISDEKIEVKEETIKPVAAPKPRTYSNTNRPTTQRK